VAAKALRPKSPVIVAIIGTGYQAHTQVLALSRVCEIQELRAYGRDPHRRAAFVSGPSGGARLARRGLGISRSRGARRGHRGRHDDELAAVLEADWVAPHALVIAAGSNFPNRVEIPAELVARARSVVVDQLATARLESGDLIQAHAAGKFDWERATELPRC